MAHGAALKEAWKSKADQVQLGQSVKYFQMCFPCNEGPGPGPHKAKVIAINEDRSVHLKVSWVKTKRTDERFVVHRGMADNGRFWDF